MGKKFTKNHALIYTKEFQSHFFLGIDALRNEESEKAKSAFKNEIKVIENLKEKIKKYDESPARNGCLKILEIAGKNAYGFLELIDFDDQWVLINKVNTLKQLNTIVTAIQSFLINAKIFNNPLDIPEFNLRWISYSKLLVFNFLYSALSSRKADFDSLDEARKWFRELKLTGFKQGVDAVENFAMTLIKEKNFDNIPQEKENRLLGLLRPVYVLGRESSLLVAMKQDNTRFMKQIRDLVKKEIREGLGSRAGKSKILKEPKPSEPEGEKAKYARMWTNQTKFEGEPINERESNELTESRKDYNIFIIDRGEYLEDSVGEVYFNDKPVSPHLVDIEKVKTKKKNENKYLTPLEYRLLFYALKHKGVAGDLFTLIKECWFKHNLANMLREMLREVISGKRNRVEFNESTSGFRKSIGELSKFLYDHFKSELRTFKTGKYRLKPIPKFCVIKVI